MEEAAKGFVLAASGGLRKTVADMADAGFSQQAPFVAMAVGSIAAGSEVVEFLAEKLKQGAEEAEQFASDHPIVTAAIVAGAVVAAAPQIVTMPMLSAAGFGPLGPVASSLAAGAQSAIGNVAAGSTFATLQSAGMGGAGAAVVNGATQLAGSLGTAAGAIWARMT